MSTNDLEQVAAGLESFDALYAEFGGDAVKFFEHSMSFTDGPDDHGLFAKLEQFAQSRGIEVLDYIPGNHRAMMDKETLTGLYSPSEKFIYVRPAMSPRQRVRTLAHELGHALDPQATGALELAFFGPQRAETFAEGVASLVMKHFGYSTRTSELYLSGYDVTPRLLRQQAPGIVAAANTLIDAVGNFDEGYQVAA